MLARELARELMRDLDVGMIPVVDNREAKERMLERVSEPAPAFW